MTTNLVFCIECYIILSQIYKKKKRNDLDEIYLYIIKLFGRGCIKNKILGAAAESSPQE